MRIGELAKITKLKIDTIRYYEKKGLIPSPPRTLSGYRIFPEETIEIIQFIKGAKELGFTLREIKELLELRRGGKGSSTEIRKKALSKLEEIGRKIKALEKIRESLERLVSECQEREDVKKCPILEAFKKNKRR